MTPQDDRLRQVEREVDRNSQALDYLETRDITHQEDILRLDRFLFRDDGQVVSVQTQLRMIQESLGRLDHTRQRWITFLFALAVLAVGGVATQLWLVLKWAQQHNMSMSRWWL